MQARKVSMVCVPPGGLFQQSRRRWRKTFDLREQIFVDIGRIEPNQSRKGDPASPAVRVDQHVDPLRALLLSQSPAVRRPYNERGYEGAEYAQDAGPGGEMLKVARFHGAQASGESVRTPMFREACA